jgi:hypothetical protein
MPELKRPVLLMPGRVLFVFSLLYLLLGCGAFFSQPLFLVWVLAGAGIIPFLAADALVLCLLADRLHITRELPVSLAQGEEV